MKKLAFFVVLMALIFGGLMAEPGLELLFNGFNIVTDVDGRVEEWTDMSGNGRHAVQPNSGQRPEVRLAGGIPVLGFDGINDVLETASFPAINQPIEVFVIWRTPVSGTQFIFDGISTTNRNALFYGTGGADNIAMFAGSILSDDLAGPPYNWVITSAVFDGANSELYIGDALLATGNAGTQSLTGLRIGARVEDRNWLEGEIAEIRVYERVLNDQERDAVRAELTVTLETLPVELSAFSAEVTSEMSVQLKWTVESETNMLGYNVLRGKTSSISDATRINSALIPASNSSETQHYVYVDEDVEIDNQYFYWLQSNDIDLTDKLYGPITLLITDQGEAGSIPVIHSLNKLKGAYPNPFNPGTNVRFSLAQAAEVSINIYNSRGQLVRNLVENKSFSRGDSHVEYWDGRDNSGTDVASGVYLTVMKTSDGFTMSRKMMLMK